MDKLTALYYSVSKGHGEICFRLLMAKANPNISDENGKSLLHVASIDNYDGILMLLIDFGGDLTATNIAGNTPLHVAASRNSDRCVKCLLKRGANRTVLNKTHQTPSKIAELGGFSDIVECIEGFDDKDIEPPPKEPCPVTPHDTLIVNNVLQALQNSGGFKIQRAPISIANQTVIEKNLLKNEEKRSRMISDSSRDTEDYNYSNAHINSIETVLENPFISDDEEAYDINDSLKVVKDPKSIEGKVLTYLDQMRSKIDSIYIGEPLNNAEALLESFSVLESSLKKLLKL